MKTIYQSYEIMTPIDRDATLKFIERCARTCYKSEDLITDVSAAKMVRHLVNLGHTAMIEHAHVTVKFITDRAVSHQIVRHRAGSSFAMESQRYVNYSKEKFGKDVTFIDQCFVDEHQAVWEYACQQAEQFYFQLIADGLKAEDARSVLPNCTKTELIVTMNHRAWRHFFELRCDKAAQKPVRELACGLLTEFNQSLPEIYEDLYDKYIGHAFNSGQEIV